MDSPTYPIHYILTVYAEQIRIKQINVLKGNISSNTYYDELILSPKGKKKQLIDQLVSEAIMQLTSRVREKKERKRDENVPHNLLLEDERRKLYGTLI
jgi:hypothetical protein